MKSIFRFVWRRSGLKSSWQKYKLERLISEWKEKRNGVGWEADHSASPVVVIIPPDPELITSSKGDEAMLSVVIRHFRSVNKNTKFIMATTGTDISDTCAQALGAIAYPILMPKFCFRKAIDIFKELPPTHCVTIGADVLDGSYDPVFSAQQLVMTDTLARRGVSTIVTGFSFSKTPHVGLKAIYNDFCDAVTFNLRDPASFERFRSFTSAPATLVADVAFLLQQDTSADKVVDVIGWIDSQRASKRRVFGVNIHPLLLELTERHKIDQMVNSFADILSRLIPTQKISILFLEHDFRGPSSDKYCLDPLEAFLQSKFSSVILRPTHQFSAAQIKGVCAKLDGVISGRMHLMIGSLGAGSPVFGLEYKDKMSGLFNHLALGDKNLTTAFEIIHSPEAVFDKLANFMSHVAEIRQEVSAALPRVKEMAENNLISIVD